MPSYHHYSSDNYHATRVITLNTRRIVVIAITIMTLPVKILPVMVVQIKPIRDVSNTMYACSLLQ